MLSPLSTGVGDHPGTAWCCIHHFFFCLLLFCFHPSRRSSNSRTSPSCKERPDARATRALRSLSCCYFLFLLLLCSASYGSLTHESSVSCAADDSTTFGTHARLIGQPKQKRMNAQEIGLEIVLPVGVFILLCGWCLYYCCRRSNSATLDDPAPQEVRDRFRQATPSGQCSGHFLLLLIGLLTLLLVLPSTERR